MPILHRLFYALTPPAAGVRAIAAHRGDGSVPGAVADHRLHMTLAIGPDHATEPYADMEAMLRLGEAVAAEPFDLALERVSGSEATLALCPRRCPPGLRALHRALDQRLASLCIRRPGWTFNPHVTLRYCKGTPFSRPIAPIAWPARDFVLIHSLVGATRHIELGRWPLVERQLSLSF